MNGTAANKHLMKPISILRKNLAEPNKKFEYLINIVADCPFGGQGKFALDLIKKIDPQKARILEDLLQEYDKNNFHRDLGSISYIDFRAAVEEQLSCPSPFTREICVTGKSKNCLENEI